MFKHSFFCMTQGPPPSCGGKKAAAEFLPQPLQLTTYEIRVVPGDSEGSRSFFIEHPCPFSILA